MDAFLQVAQNDQQGGFKQNVVTDTGGPYGVALADLNLDGNLDMAVQIIGIADAQIYLGNGKGGFTLQAQEPPYPGTSVRFSPLASNPDDERV